MAGRTLHLACACGELRARLVDIAVNDGVHVVCHCDDCRANMTALGHTDPGAEGVDLFQTTPDKVRIDKGGENLAILRLTPKGVLRWYAKCCSTPLWTTMGTRTIPAMAVQTRNITESDTLGPVTVRAFVQESGRPMRHENAVGWMTGLMARSARAWISGRWKTSELFDDDGHPTRPVHLATRQERAAALMGLQR